MYFKLLMAFLISLLLGRIFRDVSFFIPYIAEYIPCCPLQTTQAEYTAYFRFKKKKNLSYSN